jgi:ABC-2 type transport system ATP-binding protein
MTDTVINVEGLRKSYGDLEAVRGIDLEVRPGRIFAFLGPNGAGKTTTVEILEGYRRADAGTVEVLGIDPARAPLAWRARIGVVLQTCELPPELTARELVTRYAGYYPRPRPVDETIALVGLADRADVRVERLSGGQQRRLDVALALVGDPDLIFLDEPTTGFDPAARRRAWGVVRDLRELGKTVFLTTHYLDEAEQLADDVAVIVGGRIVAQGPPATLGGRDRASCEIRFRANGAGVPRGAQLDGELVRLEVDDAVRALEELLDWARARGARLEGLELRRPTLEDVYLRLTEEVGA